VRSALLLAHPARREGGAAPDSAIIATVIGVVPSVRRPNHEHPDQIIYLPGNSEYESAAFFYVRTRGDAAASRGAVRAVLRELDPRLPILRVQTVGEVLDESATGVAQMASGAGAMGVVALLLAALGLWAVLSFIVEQRRYEIGVRMALGAGAATVTRMVFRQSLLLAGIGIGLGALIAAGAASGLRNLLFGLPPLDPVAFVGSTMLLLVVALLASLGPARRAARVDPMVALRAE